MIHFSHSLCNVSRDHRVNVVSQAHRGPKVQLETLADLEKQELLGQGLVKLILCIIAFCILSIFVLDIMWHFAAHPIHSAMRL